MVIWASETGTNWMDEIFGRWESIDVREELGFT